ncbi:aminotransferase class I/II-fold pyridoxal phosphate-dependent enzyme [Francisellaceae bacterium]|nr:aminotransferase class I/II-fold pyridoxal phosphate-dependent enzyme [Francisellaceae bacterium]
MVKINNQIGLVKESATLAINQKAQSLRNQGKTVTHLGFGQAPFEVPQLIQESLRAHANEKSYLPGAGLPELRKAVASYYKNEFNYTYSSNNVLIGPGSKELLFQLLYMLSGPVLIPAASWVSYAPQATLLNKEHHILHTHESDNYCLQPEALEEACRKIGQDIGLSSQKILILNSPNNPTGAVYPQQLLEKLAVMCKKMNIIVISDEIYANINFTNKPHTSIAHYYPEGTIVTGGLSKLFSAGGYRLGVCLIPTKMNNLYQALKVMISETFSCVSSPIQFAALTAYSKYNEIKPYLSDCVKVHEIAGKYLHQRFIKMGLSCPSPQGAFYLFPSFESYSKVFHELNITTNKQLVDLILDKTQVALLPGEDFYRDINEFTCRVATTDYDGPKALKAYQNGDIEKSIIQKYMSSLVLGCDRLESWLNTL